MFRLLFFLVFSLMTTLLTGQTTFKKRFGTHQHDRAFFVEVLSDNSFLVAGGSAGGGLGGEDAMLVKFSAAGNVDWSKVYGGSNFDQFSRIFSCSDGNFLIMGQTYSMGAGGADIYVVKVDGSGNVLWERTCGGSSHDLPRGICEVSDGYIITGSSLSFGLGSYDLFIEKFDFSGASVWSNVYGSSGLDNSGDPIPASNGEVWISGYLNVGNNNDGMMMRIDASGTVVSATRIGGAESEGLFNLAPGGPYLVGSGSSWATAQLRPWLVGLNAGGKPVWSKRYVFPTGNYEINAEDCPNGGFVFAPTSMSGDVANAYLIKTDDDGNITWAKAHAFGGSGRLYHSRPAPDGGFVAVGHYNSSTQDMFILKTDANGNVEGCCPADAPVTVEVINPASPNTTLSTADAQEATIAPAQNQGIDLDEVDLCNGGECCPTDAGTMLEEMQTVCINQPATFTHNGDEILDNDDLLQFILFSDPNDTLGSIIVVSNTPVFTFNPATMQTGVTYYIAAIAGNNVGGNVDLNDPCLDISNAAELVWLPLPEVTFSVNNNEVCAGGCQTITATFTGTAPFTLTYTTPGGGPVTQTFASNTDTFQVCPPVGTPPGSFTVQATVLVDALCTCP